MDIIREIDRERINLDIYSNRLSTGCYDDEMIKRGSKVFYIKSVSPVNYIKKIFLQNYPEYQVVHIQMNTLSTIYCIGAYLAIVPVRIVHSRGTSIKKIKAKNERNYKVSYK